MKRYRIVLLDDSRQQLSAGFLFSASDESACASAERLLQTKPSAAAIQVHDGERLVCAFERA